MANAKEFIDENIKSYPVVVFSKSYCPYCKMAKEALSGQGIEYHVVEIENMDNCSAIQDVLLEMTGGRTVW